MLLMVSQCHCLKYTHIEKGCSRHRRDKGDASRLGQGQLVLGVDGIVVVFIVVANGAGINNVVEIGIVIVIVVAETRSSLWRLFIVLLSRDNSIIPLRRRADPDLGLLTVATRHDVFSVVYSSATHQVSKNSLNESIEGQKPTSLSTSVSFLPTRTGERRGWQGVRLIYVTKHHHPTQTSDFFAKDAPNRMHSSFCLWGHSKVGGH